VVFVIDSSNHDRLAEAHSELAKLMSEKELKDASLLILANKQVCYRSLKVPEIHFIAVVLTHH
jgi:tripartite motif-containing protein 23